MDGKDEGEIVKNVVQASGFSSWVENGTLHGDGKQEEIQEGE